MADSSTVSLLIRRITLLVLAMALTGAAIALPAIANNGPTASASKKCKKKSKKASVAKKKKRCRSGSGARNESTLPGVPTRPSPVAPPAQPTAPPQPPVGNVSVTDNPVLAGRTDDGQVTLNGVAPSGGQTVALSSSVPSRVSVPATVQVAAGQSTANFTATTTAGPDVNSLITANSGGTSANVLLRVVEHPSVLSLDLDHKCFPTGVTNFGSNRVSLDVAADADTPVTLQSDTTGSLTVPSSVTVPEDSKTAIFGVSTTMLAADPVTVTGTAPFGLPASDVTKVRATSTPSVLTGVSLSPDHVAPGNTTTGTVTLDCEALAGGTTINLSVLDNAEVTVPATVTVLQDQLTASFTVSASLDATGTATIQASLAGTDKTATLTIDINPT